jgi:predicted ribosomally synthesized peptide with SipW-like signal peptide
MKKIGIVSLALVLALGLGGVAYASWTDSVTITEEVNTGTFEIGVRDVGTDDGGPALGEVLNGVTGIVHPTGTDKNATPNEDSTADPSDGREDPGYNKNVGAARSTDGTAKCMHEGVQFFDGVTETIVNGYPS